MKTTIGYSIHEGAELLRKEDLVAIPTETVYGLAANATSVTALEKVFNVKQRPLYNPLIVHTNSIDTIASYVTHIPATAMALLEYFAPGPLTVLLPSNKRLPALVNNGKPLLAFRIPQHPLTLALLKELPFPLAAPSANIFTQISPTNAWHVFKNFNGKIPYILDGGSCLLGIESTVVGFDENETPVIYRQGAVTASQIANVAGKVRIRKTMNSKLSPGLSSHHYSPATPMYLVKDIHNITAELDVERTALLCFNSYNYQFPISHQFILSNDGNLHEAARNLYKAMHYLDELNLDCLIVEKVPNIGLGMAINDRLQRAACDHTKKTSTAVVTT